MLIGANKDNRDILLGYTIEWYKNGKPTKKQKIVLIGLIV